MKETVKLWTENGGISDIILKYLKIVRQKKPDFNVRA
ncbi:MAG: hypothetical protein BWY69_00768 [Planctomycetes bacterium ADurb.Bin401]|nr:MAG: hypothetical protein BWY69_00768 [Planctomycetes bacterium ADurb.Bin401]